MLTLMQNPSFGETLELILLCVAQTFDTLKISK